jgi:hypothetical protein
MKDIKSYMPIGHHFKRYGFTYNCMMELTMRQNDMLKCILSNEQLKEAKYKKALSSNIN